MDDLLDPPSASSILGGLSPVAPSQVAQDTASVPTLDEVYSQHKQGQLQDMLRPEWQQPAAFTEVEHNESAYQDEKTLLGKMLKDPVNLGYTSPQILSAAANSYNPQAMKDMAVAHRATAFLLDTPVEDLDPQKMSVYQKAVAARLGKPAPKTTTDYRNMLAEHFAGMEDMDAAIRDLTVSSVTDALADTNYGKESPVKRDMGSTVSQWMQRHPEIAADPSRHWLLARGAGDIYKNTLEDLGKVRDEAAMTLRVLSDFTQGNDKPGEMDELASKVAQLPRDDRNKLFSYVGLAAEAQQIDRGAVTQLAKNLGESLSRGFDFIPQAFAQGSQGALEDMSDALAAGRVRVNASVPEGKATAKDMVLESSPDPEGFGGAAMNEDYATARPATPEEAAAIKQTLDASKRNIQAARELKHFAQQSIDPVRPLARSNSLIGAMERGMYGLAGSVPLMGTVAINPLVGVAAYQASEFDRIMVENPDMNFRTAQTLALAEGVGNSLIDSMQLRSVLGHSKMLGTVLEGMKARGVVNYLKRTGLIAAEQYAQENVQDLIAPVFETIASALRQDMPDKDFGAEMKDYLASRPEVFFAVLPLALLGGGFSGAGDFKNLDAILSEDRMKMAGLSQTAREYILAATTPEDKVARHGEMWSKRTDEDIAEGKKFTTEKMNAALRERAAQSPLDYRLSVDTTRPDGVAEWVVSDPKGEEVFRSPEYDAAAEIISQHLASRLENDKVGAADLMAWAPTILNDPQSLTLAPKSVQQLFDEFNDKGDKTGIDNLLERLRFGNLEGKDYNTLMVLGETTVEQVKEGVYRAVMVLRENANPLDAFEEINHGFVKTALAEGKVTIDQLRDWLGQTEKATGTTIARETELEIIENLAKITQDYAAGRIDETTLPASFVDYLKRVVQVFKYALVKYTSLREAFDKGDIGNDFERFLAQSIGLDPQTDMDAVRDKTAAEINPEEQAAYSVSDPYKDRDADPSAPLTQTEMDEAVEAESGVTAEPEIDEDAWDQLDAKGRSDFSIRPGPPTEDTIPLIDHADLKGKGKFLFYSDRMRVGLYTGLDPASGISINLQGGPSYPFTLGNIDSNAGWASTTIGIWQRLVNRIDRTKDGIGVITLYGEGNIRANQTFLLAYMAEVKWAIKSGKLTEERWLEEANAIRDRALNKKLKGGTKLKDADPSGKKWLPLWTAEWTTLGQAQEALAATTFETRAGSFFGYNETKKGSNKGSIIGSDKLVKEGFPNISDMVAAMEDPRFKGLKYGDMVGAIQFEKGQTTPSDAASLNVRPHLSYDIIVKGSGLGFFRTVSSALSVLKTKKTGFQALRSAETSMADVSFSIREQDTDYLAAVERGDMETAQRMVDEAARAAGYTIGPVYHGTDVKDITEFRTDDSERPSARAAYFSGERNYASNFGANQYRAFLKIENAKEIGDIEERVTPLGLSRRAAISRNEIDSFYEAKDKMALFEWFQEPDILHMASKNHDALVGREDGHPVYLVFNPSQIKLADSATFDSQGNVIPLSQRFNPETANINYSIRDQSEIDQIETALGALNRGPEGRLAVYRMAKEKFLDVLRENRDIIDAIKATKIDVKAQLSPEVEKLDTELRDKLADLEVEELGATEEAINENEDRKQAKLEGATSREQITEINRSARERASVIKSGIASKYIEKRKALRADIAARRTALKTEANQQDVASNALLREKVQSAQFRQAVAELDGLLKALPTEVMGRVGGFSRLANMPTTDAGLGKFFLHRIEMVEREIERYLKKSYDEELDSILERSKPKKFAPGEKPKGIGAEIQRVFAAVREAVKYTPKELEAKLASLDAMLADPDISPEREAELQQISALITLAGDWKPRYEKSFNPKTGKEGYRMVSPGADSGRRASAVEALKATWAKGYAEFKRKKELERQQRDAARAEAVASTGEDGQYADRLKRSRKEHGIKGFARKMYLSLLSWDQLLGTVFGNETYVATKYSDEQRRAENNKDDAVFAKMDEIDTLLTKLSKGGTRLDGERLRYTLATEEVQIGELELTQMEMLTASMMWEQEDGRRHMLGVRNNEGDLVSDWSYDQEFMDKLEAKLSPEARAIRQFLWAKYEAEYEAINAVYKEINGIDLPKVQMYSPILVKPMQAPGGMVNDAVTGMAVSAASISPGALRTRSSTAVAEPEFRDALATYMAHTQQMEHWKAFAPMTIELNAILRNRNVQNAIEEAASREATTVLNLHLDMFAQGGNRDAAGTLGVSKDFGRVTGRAAQVALVGRIGTLLIQATQLGAAVAEMPVGAYALRLSKLLSGQLAWSDALSSDYIQRRIREMPPIVRQGLEGLKSGKPNYLKHQVARLGQLISGTDGLFTAGTYAIVLDYHRQQAERMGMNAERAEAYAQNVAQRATDRLAQPTRAGARSIYERTSNGVAGKLLWAFSSEPRKNLALAAYSVANRSTADAARTIGGLLILNTLGGAILRKAWKDAKDDDDDEVFDSKHWNPSRFAMALLTEPLQGLPVIGAAAQEGAYAASSNYYNPSNLLSPARAIQAVLHIDETLAGDRDADQMMGDLDAILSTLGLANENIAAVASLSHLAKDLFGLTENTAKTITSPPE